MGLRKTNFLHDVPERDYAKLWGGLQKFAGQLAEIVPGLPTTSPVLISGDWGSGKTTLLHAVQQKLKDETATIWFDAWRYEGESALLPALIRSVWLQTPSDLQQDEEAKGFFRTAWKCAVAVGIRAAPLVAKTAGIPFLPDLLEGVTAEAVEDDLNAVGSGRSIKPPPDPTELMWENFAKILRRGWEEHPVIILIDDLDRCSPENAVALLGGVRILINRSTHGDGTPDFLACRFMVALDKRVMAQAIAKKFGGIDNYDGNRYLEKVFPLTFDVPIPRGREVGRLVGRFLQAFTLWEVLNCAHNWY